MVKGGFRGRRFALRHAWRRSRFAVIAAGAVLALVIVSTPSNNGRSSPTTHPKDAPTTTAHASSNTSAIPVFSDRTLEAGLASMHFQGDEKLSGLNEVVGPGACAFDYDNDGWVDLFVVGGSGATRHYGKQHWWALSSGHALYRNLGNGRFKDVTASARLTTRSWGMGCATADLDNDADQDLFITGFNGHILFRNNGNGTFADITQAAGIAAGDWGSSAAIADFDADGLLDIYVANYVHYIKDKATYEKQSQFSQDKSPAFDPTLYDAQPNRLYRNTGNLKFVDVAAAAGVDNATGRGLGVAWLDVNNDQRPDLFIANDKGFPNSLYLNQGQGRFTDVSVQYRVNDARGSTGIAAGDIDNDGDTDLLIGATAGNNPLTLLNGPSPFITDTKSTDGTNAFVDRARYLGVGDERGVELHRWSVAIHDFNNDQWPDLFIANGLLSPDPDSARVTVGQPKQLWLNPGQAPFRDVSAQVGAAFSDTLSARGASFADFDNDGDIDIFVAHNNDTGQFLVNDIERQGQHWLGVALEARAPNNRDAFGAKVWVRTSSRTQFQTLFGSAGVMSDHDHRLHFGLGPDTSVAELKVRWPDGTESLFSSVPTDRYVRIVQGQNDIYILPAAKTARAFRPKLQLAIGRDKTEHRIQYLRWIAESGDSSAWITASRAAVSDSATEVRATVQDLLGKHKHREALPLVIEALNDKAAPVLVAAIRALQEYEEETSVRFLLRHFKDADPDVRCALADAFAFFFREEEAVVHRKYLAVPYLVRQLNDSNAQVRVCAARALGDSERYRAVDPLIDRLKDSASTVRAEAARALGLVRERKAIPALVKVLQKTSEQPPVLAQVLIALKRLDDPELDLRIDRLLHADPVKTLLIFRTIFEDQLDGVVFNRKLLLQKANDTIAATSHPLSAEDILLVIGALSSGQTLSVTRSLDPWLHHTEPKVRAAAYDALMRIDVRNRPTLALAALNDDSPHVRGAALRSLKTYPTTVPRDLLLKQLQSQDTVYDALPLVHPSTHPDIEPTLVTLAIEGEDPLVAAAAIAALAPFKQPLPETLFSHSHEAVRLAAFRHWLQRQPQFMAQEQAPPVVIRALQDIHESVRGAAADMLLERKEAWAHRLVRQLLLSDAGAPDVRHRLLSGLNSNHIEAKEWVLTLAKSAQGELRLNAIARLAAYRDAATEQYLWQLLQNKAAESQHRFAAATALWSGHKTAVISQLEGKTTVNYARGGDRIWIKYRR